MPPLPMHIETSAAAKPNTVAARAARIAETPNVEVELETLITVEVGRGTIITVEVERKTAIT